MTNESVAKESKSITDNNEIQKATIQNTSSNSEQIITSAPIPTRTNTGIKKSSSLKLPSLADIKSGNYQIQKEVTKEAEAENLPNNKFDDFDFNQAWSKCVEMIASKNQHSLNAMISAAKPVLDCENFKAKITFNNKIQHDLFLSEKPHFIGILREMIQNYAFDFVLEIDTDKEDLVPYTNADKFKVMSGKNPALIKLKDSFNLDIN